MAIQYRQPKQQLRYEYIVLVLITLLAGSIRFFQLGAWSFWIDEIFTIENALEASGHSLATNLITQPISTLLISGVLHVVGIAEGSARLIPASIGVLSIPILYFPLRKMFDPVVALLTLLALALSPWHLYFSQNTRYYTLLLLFYMLAFCIFYLGVEQNRRWYLLVAFLLLWLAFRERLFALFFVPVVVSYVGVLQLLPFGIPAMLRIKRMAPIIGLMVLGAGAFLLYDVFFVETTTRSFVAAFALKFLGQSDWKPHWLLTGSMQHIGTPIVGLALIGGVVTLWQRSRAGLFVVLGALVPLASLMVLAPFTRTTTHYALMILPCWFILAAIGVKALYYQAIHHRAWLVLLATSGMLVLFTQDRVLDDSLHYFGDRVFIIYGVVLAIGVGLLCLTVTTVLQRVASLQKTMARWGTGQTRLLWGSIVVFALLFHPALKLGLYHFYEHGYRVDWKAAAAIVQAQQYPDDVVYTTLPPLGTYYFGDAAQPMGDLLRRQAIDLNTILESDRRAWFIEESGVDQLMGDTFATWSQEHCTLAAVLDNRFLGEDWKLRVHLCTPGTTSEPSMTS